MSAERKNWANISSAIPDLVTEKPSSDVATPSK
ncbi:hypothetical protein Bhyg_09623 [Pseudolycoriella hygida]|uniref:Uncharacterized protein n=1 Tax=Pseudolycoriella hygida TaxID=35572 RepID=A0A9Q0S4K1_9DIPT|nr:hypothetical protein Bhyg_09623 [Pseudolycoriella hygida]